MMIDNSTARQVTTACCSSECSPHRQAPAVEAENQLSCRQDIFDPQLDARLSSTAFNENYTAAISSPLRSTTTDERAVSNDRHRKTVNGNSTSGRVLQYSSAIHRRQRAADCEDKDTMLRRPGTVVTSCGVLHNDDDDNDDGTERCRGANSTSGIGKAISTSPVTSSR